MNNYDEKIIQIKETEKQLLEFAKNKISECNDNFNENVSDLIEVLDYDDKMVKKYEAVIASQKLIKDLADEIKDATNVEEIIIIRMKLNYYINKIKKELKDRDVCSTEINKYTEKANKLRKGISDYIRYLKREDKIEEIEFLNNKSDITEEESIRLKRLLKNEVSYGKRNISKYINSVVEKPKETKEEKITEKKVIKRYRYIKDYQEIEENNDNNDQDQNIIARPGSRYIRNYPGVITSSSNKDKKVTHNGQETKYATKTINKKKHDIEDDSNRGIIRATKTYDSLYDFLDEKVSAYAKQYKIVTPENYTKNVIKNITIYIKNLPVIIKNKSKVKRMAAEYVLFRHKPELSGYLEYVKRDNAILNSFKKAIEGSSLASKEEYLKEEHRKCIVWIIKFFKDNNIECNYNKHA